MELTRVIHPIGQGGFYTETLKNNNGNEFNVVYDCGGNGQKFMSDYLDSCFPKRQTIDMVFVSHFHDDHINGLMHLLKKNDVRKLIIPQLTPDLMLEALFYNYQRTGAFNNRINQFLFSIYGQEFYGNRKTRIIQILPNIDDNNDGVIVEEFSIDDHLRSPLVISYNGIKVAVEKEMRSGTVFSVGKWFYIPFNPPVPKKKTREGSFYDYFKERLNDGKDFEFTELHGIVKRKFKDCITVYKDYFKSGENHNAYSMTLFSGMRKPKGHIIMSNDRCNQYCCDCVPFYHFHRKPNFLYTGDFEPNNTYCDNIQLMKQFYGSLWDTFDELQVPHHGSRNNFSKDLYTGKHIGYISAGEKNRFNHPNKDTLLDIMNCGCVPQIVSDDVSTIVVNKYEVAI